MYRQNLNRTFVSSNVSLLVAGTLILLITSLFMNAGGGMKISSVEVRPNLIVMNTIVGAAASGFLVTNLN